MLDRILKDYYSLEMHPQTFYIYKSNTIFIKPDKPGISDKNGSVIVIRQSDSSLSGWAIDHESGGSIFCIGVIQFDEFPKGVRIRFVITYNKLRSNLENIAREIITRWKALGISIEPFDLEDFVKKGESNDLKGMSDWRKRRALLFKEIKVQNPDYTKSEVAVNAKDKAFDIILNNLIDEQSQLTGKKLDDEVLRIFKHDYSHGKDEFSDTDVKNDYKAMRWNWIGSRSIK